MKTKIVFCFLAWLIILAGVSLRFFDLEKIPPGMHYDEAFNGLDAIRAIETGDYKIFYTDNGGREGLHINAQAFFIKLFGISNFSLRFANAIWGSLAIIGFFFLLRELKFSRIAILAGTFALAFSFWHLDFSRSAYRGIMVPLILIWLFYFFIRGISREKYKYANFSLAGILLGLGFHTYIAFRAVPLIFLILAAAFIVFKKYFIKNYWRQAAVFIAVSLSIALPILIYFTQHKNELMVRTESVSIFDNPQIHWTASLKKSFLAHMGAFIWQGDANPRFNYNRQPLIPFFWQAFFLAGFVLSIRELYLNFRKLRRSKKENSDFQPSEMFNAAVVSQAAFWIMLIPGVLSIEGVPHSLRIIGALPSAIIFLAWPFQYFSSFLKKRKKIALIFAAVFLAGGIYQSYVYFFPWAIDPRTIGGYEKKLYDLGLLAKQAEPKESNYIIVTQTTSVSRDNKESSFKTSEYIGYPNIKKYLFYKPSRILDIDCAADIVIIYEDKDNIKDRYLDKCPAARAEFKTPAGGMYGFWVIEK